ncbi:MAG: hypothetical protein WCV80_03515 [Candidatus Paceibacterota bacterium]|jgi:predicted MFS family arabinose efflux permease
MNIFFAGFNELDISTALLVFGATVISDMLWAFYIRRTNDRKALSAALFSAVIVLSGGLIVVAYVENNWYLLPAAMGAFVGTFISIHIDMWKHEREKTKHSEIE